MTDTTKHSVHVLRDAGFYWLPKGLPEMHPMPKDVHPTPLFIYHEEDGGLRGLEFAHVNRERRVTKLFGFRPDGGLEDLTAQAAGKGQPEVVLGRMAVRGAQSVTRINYWPNMGQTFWQMEAGESLHPADVLNRHALYSKRRTLEELGMALVHPQFPLMVIIHYGAANEWLGLNYVQADPQGGLVRLVSQSVIDQITIDHGGGGGGAATVQQCMAAWGSASVTSLCFSMRAMQVFCQQVPEIPLEKMRRVA